MMSLGTGGAGNDFGLAEPFAAFVADDATAATVERWAAGRGWSPASVQRGDAAAAAATLAVVPPPRLLLVDIEATEDPVAALAEVIRAAPGTSVLALGAVNDVALYRRLRQVGVFDYLPKPIEIDELDRVAANAEAPVAPVPAGERVGRVAMVVGVRGGVGATTLTASIARLVADECERRVAAIDLDLASGSLGLALDAESPGGLLEALAQPDRLDALFIERAAVQKSRHLWVLAAGEDGQGNGTQPDTSALVSFLAEVRRGFEVALVDLPRWYLNGTGEILAGADMILLVTDLSIAGLRDSRRLVRVAAEAAPGAVVRVVATRAGLVPNAEVSAPEFARALGRPIDRVVPFDPAIACATHAGQPAAGLRRRAPALGAMRGLAREVAGGGKGQQGWLRRFLGR